MRKIAVSGASNRCWRVRVWSELFAVQLAAIGAGAAVLSGERLGGSIAATVAFGFALFQRNFNFLYNLGGDFFLGHDGARQLLN
jgi:hypothetical protein